MNKSLVFSILMVVAMIFWGASWPSSKILVQYTSADVITFWRFFFALLASIPLLVIFRIPLRIESKDFKLLILVAFFNSLYSILFFTGLNYGSAGKGGVLVTTMTPVFTYLLTFAIHKWQKDSTKTMSKNEILGLILGIFSGICLLNLHSLSELFGRFNTFFLLAALDWAFLTILTHKIRIHPIAINFYITFLSVIYWLPLFYFQPHLLDIFDFDLRFWGMLFVVAVLSTALGTSVYYMGVFYVGAAKASTFPLLVPASALITSYLILGEIPSFLTLFGGTLAIVAIYLINLYKPKSDDKSR